MAISIVGEIERLINERGSAAILQKHVALLKDEIALLEKKARDFELQTVELEAKVKTLESENENLNIETQKLKENIHNLTAKKVNYKMKWGCVLFEQDETLYCPSCFFGNSKKIPTSRVNTNSRFCSVCKTTIPTG